MIKDVITTICEDCLREACEKGFINTLLLQTFTLVEKVNCEVGYDSTCANDGFPICPNNCANWPSTTSNTSFGCACECHR